MREKRELHQTVRFRMMLLVLATALIFVASAATRARAAVMCVDRTDASCTTQYVASQFQAALTAAQNNSEPDTILMGPGYFETSTTGFTFQNQNAEGSLQIIGSGDTTKITNWNTGLDAATTGLYFNAGPGSKVSNLSIVIPANADTTTDTGLVLGQFASADNVYVGSTNNNDARGIATHGGNVLNSTIDFPILSLNDVGVDGVDGSYRLSNSNVRAQIAVRHSDPAATTTVERSTITGNELLQTDGGHFKVHDSLLALQPGNGNTGITLSNESSGGVNPDDFSAELDGTTIIGAGNSDSQGIVAVADSGQESASVDVRNSLITNVGTPLLLAAGGGRTLTATSDYSMYDTDMYDAVTHPNGVFITNNQGGVAGNVDYSPGPNNLDLVANLGFVNGGAGDYSLTASSPLVDKGDPAVPGAGVTDRRGNVRACNGTPGGVKRRDIGAFEYNDCIDPDTSITSGPEANTEDATPAFTVTSPNKPASTFRCSFDGSAAAACGAGFDAPDLGLGPHTVTVAAVDNYGNVDPTPAARSYTVIETLGPPSCSTDPALCPVVDRTAPKITLIGKLPKKTTKKSLKVKFRSNEAGSAFTCKVGKGKAKKCKSPYTLKLKKGKNALKVIATDKAGNKSKTLTVSVKRK